VVLNASALGQSADSARTKPIASAEFEAATITPHLEADPGVSPDTEPQNRFEAKNVTAKMLVQLAFNLPPDRVLEAPLWARSQSFDMTGQISDTQWQDLNKLDDDHRSQSIQHMLQSLLAQRFHLAVSHQQKDLLVFALVVDKNTGAKLPTSGTPKLPELFDTTNLATTLHQDNVPVSALANLLSARFGRTVLDCTGLSEHYDISLRVEIPDENSPDSVNRAIFNSMEDRMDRAIFSALEDQLGLKLVTRRQVLDTISIDHIELPSDD
jgi:uncharacterized protein (TIGR03435 family)